MGFWTKNEERSLRKDVRYVAGLLDKHRPGWPNLLVNAYGPQLMTMQVASPFRCVLYATHGGYNVGRDALGIDFGECHPAIATRQPEVNEYWLEEVRARLATTTEIDLRDRQLVDA